MMKVLLLCSSDVMAIPSALKLRSAGLLAGIVFPQKHAIRLSQSFKQAGFDADVFHTCSKETLAEDFISAANKSKADVVIVITFPWKIPADVFSAMPKGCYNFHPGALPKYRGADPIFWQIKNRESYITFSVHLMNDDVDSGPLICQEHLPLSPDDTYGMVAQNMSWLIAETFPKFIDLIKNGKTLGQIQESMDIFYKQKPTHECLRINWNKQTSGEIQALVNACNPRYNGAITMIKNRQINIVEVALINVNNAPGTTVPGEIIHSDELYGPIISCIDNKFLKLNVVCMNEGFLSGSKLFKMGFTAGICFG